MASEVRVRISELGGTCRAAKVAGPDGAPVIIISPLIRTGDPVTREAAFALFVEVINDGPEELHT